MMGFYFNCPYCYGDQHRPNVIKDGITECDYCHKQIKLRGDIPEKQLEIKQEINMPQLRMQALTLLKDIIRPSIPLIDVNKDLYNTADQLVHYCLTGEHQLPEKKE